VARAPSNRRDVVLASVRRALQGRCFDCYGKGQRENIVRNVVQCKTCGGSGRLVSMTVAQVALGADVRVAEALDALETLEHEEVASRLLPVGNTGADKWHLIGGG
jgi:hypothetical protein